MELPKQVTRHEEFLNHKNAKVTDINGVHGLKYMDGKLSIFKGKEWHVIGDKSDSPTVPEVTLYPITNFVGSSATSGKTVNISWVDPRNMPHYWYTEIYDSVNDIQHVPYESLETVASKMVMTSTITNYSMPTTHNTRHYFKAYAVYNVNGEKRVSDGAYLTVLAQDTELPNVVTNINASPDQNTIALTWTNPTDSDLAKVRLVMKVGGYPTSENDGTVIYEGKGTSHTQSNLNNGTSYYFRFFTYDHAGNINKSTTMQVESSPIVLSSVSNLKVTQTTSGTPFTITWTKPNVPTFYMVEVFVSTQNISSYTYSQCASSATLIYSGFGTSDTYPAVVGNTYYFKAFVVHNINGDYKYDVGVSTSLQSKNTIPSSRTGTITGLQGDGREEGVMLWWNNPTDVYFDKVILRYKTGSYPTSPTDGTGVNTTTGSGKPATSTHVRPLSIGTTYYFRFFTVDKDGNINNTTTGQQVAIVAK